ncbi:MAG TPA: hypothetical protein DHW02_13650 [Ktedonobacter sp.]|nr:hypothetical protein [Ktedonobacter sp.]
MSNEQQETFSQLNEIQRLQFELLRHTHYNLLDGERVVNDLLAWRELWYSATAGRLPMFPEKKGVLHIELVLLRTTRWEQWPVDMLYIWTNDEHIEILRKRIEERWEPSDIGAYTPDEEMHWATIRDPHDRVLWVWWD